VQLVHQGRAPQRIRARSADPPHAYYRGFNRFHQTSSFRFL
jgi:hypothetical protein